MGEKRENKLLISAQVFPTSVVIRLSCNRDYWFVFFPQEALKLQTMQITWDFSPLRTTLDRK